MPSLRLQRCGGMFAWLECIDALRAVIHAYSLFKKYREDGKKAVLSAKESSNMQDV